MISPGLTELTKSRVWMQIGNPIVLMTESYELSPTVNPCAGIFYIIQDPGNDRPFIN